MQEQNNVIRKFTEQIRNLEINIDRKQRDQEVLECENKQLKIELDEFRFKDSKYI